MAKRKITDAQEPNAGYDFHVIWAIRKSLELLNFLDDGLKSVAVENLDPVDSNEIDRDGDILLGVDLTEYYGGERFTNAKRVIVSQLKYSTRHPELEWTASKITTGKKAQSGSIIHRLGTIYDGFTKQYPRAKILEKLQLKLVSNRPVSPLVISIVEKAKLTVEKKVNPVPVQNFKKLLTVKERHEVDKFFKAAKLKGTSFVDFLSLLDFSDCNTDSRFIQKKNSIDAISNLGAYDARAQYNSLHTLVREKTMVAAKGNNVIYKEDILLEFDFPDIQSMFPVPQKIETLKVMVDREQMQEIKENISEGSNTHICLHGGAGTGKSTISKSIASILPVNSITILFDCYGRGSYQDPDDKRHKHEKAFLFLCNELAVKSGSPFLIKRSQNNDYYIAEFKRRLLIAAEILRKTDPSAMLTIIIDAADNSVAAAQLYNERCFLHDLLNLEFPENARLLITTRTNRLDNLLLPDFVKTITVKEFSLNETRTYLSHFYKKITEEEIVEFRKLTKGIPRVMYYTLETEGKTLMEKLGYLNPGGKDLDDIFKQLLKNAERKSGDSIAFRKVLTYLISLPRPVPLKYLIQSSGVEKNFIEDIAIDLWKGLVFENQIFSFRDEDFEHYLNNHFKASQKNFKEIAELFLKEGDADDYTSIHLGNFLSLAGRQNELKDIVLSRSFLKRPVDLVRNKEVFIERARLAMKYSSLQDNRLTFLKLQAVAADASKTNTVLEDIMIKNPELISLFHNSQTSKKLYFQGDNPEWFGRVHLRSAAILSRNSQTHDPAKEHLKNAEAWLRYRNSLSDEKRGRYDISEQDLAFGGEAYLRLGNVKACVGWFSRWKPKEFVFDSIRKLLNILLTSSELRKIYYWLRKTSLRVDIQLQINRVFFEQGLALPFSPDKMFKQTLLLLKIKSKLKITLKQSVMSYVEQMARHGMNKKKIQTVLDVFDRTPLNSVPGFYGGAYGSDDSLSQMDLYFRATLLHAKLAGSIITLEDMLPERLKVSVEKMEYQVKQSIEEDKRKFNTFYNHLLPVYQLRINLIFRTITTPAIKKDISSIIARFDSDHELEYRYRYDAKYLTKFIAAHVMNVIFFINRPNEIISVVISKIQSSKKDNIAVCLEMADKLSVTKRYGNNVLQLLGSVDAEIERQSLAGRTQIEHYTEATIIASRISESAGKEYFDKMVASSKEIDLEAHDQIRCVDHLTNSLQHLKNPRLAFEFARFAEHCSERLKDWDGFPWPHAFSSIAKLDTASAFSIACRWDHRNVRTIDHHFTELLLIALKNNTLDHKQVAGLLPINPYYWSGLKDLLEELIKKYNSSGNNEEKNVFVANMINDFKLNCTTVHSFTILSNFLELIKDGRFLNKKLVDDFEAYCNKLRIILKVNGEEETTKRKPAYKKEKGNRKILKGLDVTNVKQIEELLSQNKITRKDFRDNDADTILDLIFESVKADQYVGHLTALIDISPDLLGYYSFKPALTKRLDKWAIYPEVKLWKKDNFEKVIRSRFSHYIRYADDFAFYSLEELAVLFGIDNTELCHVIISVMPDYINDLSASSLWLLFNITSTDADITVKQNFIDWLLQRWNENIKPEFGDGLYNASFKTPNNISKVIAGFLRYNLGHPDKRIRWRAAHAMVNTVTYGQIPILEELLRHQNKPDCYPFQHKDYTFYWIASKLWLWIGIEKLTVEIPGAMKKYGSQLYKELMNADLPHAQIQLFIKSSCLNLHEKFRKLYNTRQISGIRKSLTTSLKPVKRTDHTRGRQPARDDNFRFQFDTLDTVHHWYEPLGRIFNLSGYDVAHIAEEYICEKWGYNGNVREDNHVESQEYELTRHYKSDIPVIEDLRTYYEYHAMHCSAGQLIKTTPIIKEPNSYEDWNEWLENYFLLWDKLWLSDLKDPLPLQSKFWIENTRSPEWEWDVSLKDLNEVVGLVNPEKEGFIVVHAGLTINYGKDYEDQSVHSVLVDPKYARSLLRTFQTGDRHDLYMPYEEDDNEHEYDEDTGERVTKIQKAEKFNLCGLVNYITRGKEGVDEFEPEIATLDKGRLVPGNTFSKWGGLTFSRDYRFGYRDKNYSDPVSILQNWSNATRKDSYGNFSSKGQRLFIKKNELFQFLAAMKNVLLLQSTIHRRRERTEYRDDYSYYTLIYLIYGDGKIETLKGNYRPG